MFLLNTENGKVLTYEEWCYAVYDNFISQQQFDNLLECTESGDLI